jgi:hypothetical protein
VGDGVVLAEIFEQRGQRCQPEPDRRAAELAPAQLVAPSDQMRARHRAEFLRTENAGEAHEILHRIFVGPAGVPVADVGEPFDLGRHVGEFLKLGGGQEPVGRLDSCRSRVRFNLVESNPAIRQSRESTYGDGESQ